MLAHRYNPSRITYPIYVQPKLNGIRGIYDPRTRHFQSRYGETWSNDVVKMPLMALTALGNVFLDGEFYCHGMSLQEINSRIAVTRVKPHAETDKISFHIFDVIARKPFCERVRYLESLSRQFSGVPGVEVVETQLVSTEREADFWYNHWKNTLGYEGMMYRECDATYGLESQCGNKENRWWCLQKRKGSMDLDAVIVGFNEMLDSKTKQPKGTLGSFELQSENGAMFSAGSGLTAEQRDRYWADRDSILGCKVRIEFETFSDNGTPLKPIVALVYE